MTNSLNLPIEASELEEAQTHRGKSKQMWIIDSPREQANKRLAVYMAAK